MKQYKATITFTMDEAHPDKKYVKDWTENQKHTFSDTYTFNADYEEAEILAYIKRDLKLVAGGGYNTDHIHNVQFEIERV